MPDSVWYIEPVRIHFDLLLAYSADIQSRLILRRQKRRKLHERSRKRRRASRSEKAEGAAGPSCSFCCSSLRSSASASCFSSIEGVEYRSAQKSTLFSAVARNRQVPLVSYDFASLLSCPTICSITLLLQAISMAERTIKATPGICE